MEQQIIEQAAEAVTPETTSALATVTNQAEAAGAEFLALVFTLPNMLIMGATWSIISAISKFFPKVFDGKRGRQLKEAIPVPMCMAFVWIPGAVEGDPSAAYKIFLGAILGMGTEWLHQKVNRILLGGRRDKDAD